TRVGLHIGLRLCFEHGLRNRVEVRVLWSGEQVADLSERAQINMDLRCQEALHRVRRFGCIPGSDLVPATLRIIKGFREWVCHYTKVSVPLTTATPTTVP